MESCIFELYFIIFMIYYWLIVNTNWIFFTMISADICYLYRNIPISSIILDKRNWQLIFSKFQSISVQYCRPKFKQLNVFAYSDLEFLCAWQSFEYDNCHSRRIVLFLDMVMPLEWVSYCPKTFSHYKELRPGHNHHQ